MSVVTLGAHRYLAVWSGQTTATGSLGSIWLYDEHYRRVGVITAGGHYLTNGVDLHEFRITPQGDALLGIWETVRRPVGGRWQPVIQYVIQKLSLVHTSAGIRTGRLLFQWKSLAHIPAAQSHQADPRGGAWDYFHGNSVAQDSDGNLLISGRNTWGVYKVSVKTGRVMWEVGGKGDRSLSRPWCDQHDVTPLGHNRYSLFDDGGSGAGCEAGISGHAARALVFRVIPTGGRPEVRLIHSYIHTPAIESRAFGSVQSLPDGNLLVDWGTTPELTEYAPDGRQVNLDLSLSYASYRAFEYPWVGRPRTPPAVAAAGRGAGTEIWASWNGATLVSAWRVLAGPSASQLQAVTGRLPRTGFETAMFLRRRYAALAVQALARNGHVLGTSRIIQPAGGTSPASRRT
jgi:hypothetical protein